MTNSQYEEVCAELEGQIAEVARLRAERAALLAAADADALMLTQVGRERDRLQTECSTWEAAATMEREALAACRAELAAAVQAHEDSHADFTTVADDRDRLADVLADTPENWRPLIPLIPGDAGLALSRARKILAFLRARVGLP